MTEPLLRIESVLVPLRTRLLQHEVYRELSHLQALQNFMQYHVFAVWDFMSLLKSLQQKISCVTLPWLPPRDAAGCRLINEIVLGEESDLDRHGNPASHFDLYRQSMRDCGASTDWIDRFHLELKGSGSVSEALDHSNLPSSIRSFVEYTFEVIQRGDVCEIAAAFTFGREDLLPAVFQCIVEQLDSTHGGVLAAFRYYLDRHIQLDGEEHGPMAARLIMNLCGTDPGNWQRVERTAVASLEQRLILWDGILHGLHKG